MAAAGAGININRVTQAVTWLLLALLAAWAVHLRMNEVLAWPVLDHPLGPRDPDPWMRLAEVRRWLSGAGFYNHLVPGTNAPFGGIESHWTRPLDFLLAAAAYLAPASTIGMRLMMAAAIVPVLLGLLSLALMEGACRRCFDHTHVLWTLVLVTAFNPLPSYFAPGDADHHSLLAALWCGVIYFLIRPLTKGGGFVMGLLLGLMLWVSVEALGVIALVFGLLGLFALHHPREMKPLAMAALGAAVMPAIGVFAETPADKVLSTVHYDTLSIAHVVLMFLVAAGAQFAAAAFPRLSSPGKRLLAAAAAALAVAGVMHLGFPKFFAGPMADADPFVFSYFLPQVEEATPLYRQPPLALWMHSWEVFVALGLLLASFHKGMGGRRRRMAVTLGLLLTVMYGMTQVEARWTYYLQPLALVAIAATLPGWCALAQPKALRWLRGMRRLFRPYAGVGILAALCLCVLVATSRHPRVENACHMQARYVVQTGQLQKQLGLKPDIIYLPLDIGGEAQFFTPYRVIAGMYHREGKGMRDYAAIEAAKTPEAARRLLAARKVDALLLCPPADKESWINGVSAAHHPKWLRPARGMNFMDAAGGKPQFFIIK